MNTANNDNQSQAIPTAAADKKIPADAANDIVNSLVSRLDNAYQNSEAGGPSATSEERDAEIEDALAEELAQGDAFSDYDLKVTEEGAAISEYLALLDSTGKE